MKTIAINSELELDFPTASNMAQTIVETIQGGSSCLSWYDKIRDHENPAHVSECHDACEIPGYLDYASNRGAEIKVDFNNGTFVFCFRSTADFDES